MRSILPALVLATTAAIPAYNLSGTVTDASGNALAGVWVGLAQAKISTKTASNGTWSINGVSGIEVRADARRTEIANHLVVDGGRLRLSLTGLDVAGRILPQVRTSTPISTASARKMDAVLDTLYFVGDNTLLGSRPITAADLSGISVVVDTAFKFPYRTSSDTLFVTNPAYLQIDCYNSTAADNANAAPDFFYTAPRPEADPFALTAAGLELRNPVGAYLSVGKFTRLSGSASSIQGTYRLGDDVYRPAAGVSVPDSTQRILAEDSAIANARNSAYSYRFVFSSDSISRTIEHLPSAGTTFLFNWASRNDRFWYDTSGDTWNDEGQYSDSALYDIAFSLVDSNTVRLVGNQTQEIVTITGTKSPFGWDYDYTYTSSDPTHLTGTQHVMPTTCPNGPDWLSTFKSDNSHTTLAAARKLPGKVVKPVPHGLFLFR
jgi:hypothetical protein